MTELVLHEDFIDPALGHFLLQLTEQSGGPPRTIEQIFGEEEWEDICACCREKLEGTIATLAELRLIPLIPSKKKKKGRARYYVCSEPYETALARREAE